MILIDFEQLSGIIGNYEFRNNEIISLTPKYARIFYPYMVIIFYPYTAYEVIPPAWALDLR